MDTGAHRILVYEYVADVVARRGPHREAHLAHIRAWIGSGSMLAAGATGDPPTGALFVFADVPDSEISRFADEDPYAAAGLVSTRRIVPWTVVDAA